MRLPTHLKPLAYNVSLVPFIIPGNFTIKGSVLIILKAIEDGADNITIHSVATNISHQSGNIKICQRKSIKRRKRKNVVIVDYNHILNHNFLKLLRSDRE